jgi:hypothetical protein
MNQRLYKLINTGNAFLALPFSKSCCVVESNSTWLSLLLWLVGGTRRVVNTTEAWNGEFLNGVPSPGKMRRLQPSRNSCYRPQASPLHLWSLWALLQLCTPIERGNGRWVNSGILSSVCRWLAPDPEPCQGTLHTSAMISQQTVGRGCEFLHGRTYGPLRFSLPLISTGERWLPWIA